MMVLSQLKGAPSINRFQLGLTKIGRKDSDSR